MGRGHDGVAVVLGSRTREDPTCEDADKLPGSVLSGSRCIRANPVQSRKEPPVRLLLGLRLQRAPARCAGASRYAALERNVAWDREYPPKREDLTQFDYAAEDVILSRATDK